MDPVTPSSKNLVNLDQIDGFYIPKHYVRADIISDVMHKLHLESGDLVIATYPKSGTTWIQYIVWHILNKDAPSPSLFDMNHRVYPYMEMVGLDVLKDRPHPWLVKTHIPYTHVDKHPEAKYIYVARNPKDVCVSYFPFLKQRTDCIPDDMSFKEFFDCFVEGRVPYNDPIDHVLSWYEHKNDPNVLFLTYEEMQQNPAKAILDIAHFISPEHYKKLLKDSGKQLGHIVKCTSFEAMKKIPTYAIANPSYVSDARSLTGLYNLNEEAVRNNPQHFSKVEFFRKGIMGDWKNHLTDEMNERMEAIMDRKLKSTPDLYQLWLQN